VLWIYVIGVASAAVSGVLAASRKRLDWFGASVVAIVTAVGGGTTRDLLLGQRPVFWVTDPSLVGIAFSAALGTIGFTRRYTVPRRALLWVDAVALGAFAVLGARVALEAGATPVMAVVLGAMTSVVGGVLRDLLCVEIPVLFRGEVYALAALAGAATYVALVLHTHADALASAAGTAVALTIRVIAILAKVRIPVVPHRDIEAA
jgi:uncharacterized membrane protein YeiH